jgi:hypothetical protein
MKKPSILLLLTTALIAQQSAVAQLPFGPQFVGRLDETITFCSHAKPQQANALKQSMNLFFQLLPAKDLDAARKSNEYRKGRAQTKESLSELNKAGIDHTCAFSAK